MNPVSYQLAIKDVCKASEAHQSFAEYGKQGHLSLRTSKTVARPIGALILFSLSLGMTGLANGAENPPPKGLGVNWNKVVSESKATPTLQVVVNPPLRRGSPIHDRVFEELKGLGAEYIRYVPWLPYPKLGVAELKPPGMGETYWDFSLIDPMTIDFLKATQGHAVLMNFSTIPQWMFCTPEPVSYPDNPDKPVWNYTQGTELRDPTMKELGDYYARLVSWYTQGGFIDELGRHHDSGYHYKFDYWEVLNEPDIEHATSPEQYTARYDAIVTAIRKVAPDMKFVGLALAFPSKDPRMFEFFLNPSNHKPGVPLDMISYHFYGVPTEDQSPEVQQFTFFEQADHFLDTVRYVESIRKRLAPATRTTVNEIGSISADDFQQGEPGYVAKPVLDSYWHLSGALYAYVFGNLASLGIDVVGESQLVGYPTQFSSVSMVDWNTGKGNARFRVLELLKKHIGPGDKLVTTAIDNPYVYAQGFITRAGAHKVLLVNKRDRTFEVPLNAPAVSVEYVDKTTGAKVEGVNQLMDRVMLRGFGVAVVTFLSADE